MKGTILTIDVDGTETLKEVGGPTLGLLKEAIGGGLIEVVPMFNRVKHGGAVHGCVAFCDEEGKLEGQHMNVRATSLWQWALLAEGHPGLYRDGQIVDYLVGKIAIVWGDRAFMEAL